MNTERNICAESEAMEFDAFPQRRKKEEETCQERQAQRTEVQEVRRAGQDVEDVAVQDLYGVVGTPGLCITPALHAMWTHFPA